MSVRGEITGDEDLLILGKVEGDITFRKNRVTVGKGGKARADVRGKSVHVEGEVVGNLFGEEEVIIHQSGIVEGNITAPRVSLENGSQFKGSIDMGPSEGERKGAPASGGGGKAPAPEPVRKP
ncbi:MAG: polymer-forming cytoskeletal protein [Acidobacteria bacterium]|nr:polymer-forming cytoskeletal protein [Acidobacteriota bacterium]